MSLTKTPASLVEASRVTRLDSHTYRAHLHQAYCVAAVPNGGYVATTILRAARLHLESRDQTDTISAHWQFANKTSVGPVILSVEDAKLGRGLSVLHITLFQNDLLPQYPWVSPTSVKAASAYITNGNIEKEEGVTLPSGWTLGPTPPPPVDLGKLSQGKDPNWTKWMHPLRPKIQSLQNVDLYLPRKGHPLKATHDVWVRLANGELWMQDDLGFLLDVGPPLIVESFRPPQGSDKVPEGGFAHSTWMWYPTIVASLEVKKRLPCAGVQWLRYRVVCKSIKNGRFDAEVLIFDIEGDLIALSHHVAMAVGIERNLKSKPKVEGKL